MIILFVVFFLSLSLSPWPFSGSTYAEQKLSNFFIFLRKLLDAICPFMPFPMKLSWISLVKKWTHEADLNEASWASTPLCRAVTFLECSLWHFLIFVVCSLLPPWKAGKWNPLHVSFSQVPLCPCPGCHISLPVGGALRSFCFHAYCSV